MSHILCLDIDGVLHPADSRVLLDFSSPDWMLAIQARTQGLFRWESLLAHSLKGSDTRLLIHSTWRRLCSDSALKKILGQDLGPRVIIADSLISQRDRVNLSHSVYIEQVLMAGQKNRYWGGAETLSVLIIDDRPELFSNDFGRLDPYSPMLVTTKPNLGISDPHIQNQVSQWARAAHHAHIGSYGRRSFDGGDIDQDGTDGSGHMLMFCASSPRT